MMMNWSNTLNLFLDDLYIFSDRYFSMIFSIVVNCTFMVIDVSIVDKALYWDYFLCDLFFCVHIQLMKEIISMNHGLVI